MAEETCTESWPAGVIQGIDIPCRRPAKHSGLHQNVPRSRTWEGKLTEAQRERREQIRAGEFRG